MRAGLNSRPALLFLTSESIRDELPAGWGGEGVGRGGQMGVREARAGPGGRAGLRWNQGLGSVYSPATLAQVRRTVWIAGRFATIMRRT
jgi:hypothetical protein